MLRRPVISVVSADGPSCERLLGLLLSPISMQSHSHTPHPRPPDPPTPHPSTTPSSHLKSPSPTKSLHLPTPRNHDTIKVSNQAHCPDPPSSPPKYHNILLLSLLSPSTPILPPAPNHSVRLYPPPLSKHSYPPSPIPPSPIPNPQSQPNPSTFDQKNQHYKNQHPSPLPELPS